MRPSNELPRTTADTGLSLDALSSAFAEMLSTGEDPYGSAEPDIVCDDAPAGEPGGGSASEACEISPTSILEAMLFVGSATDEPLTSERVASLMRGVRAAEIDAAVRDLNERYRVENRPYQIISEGAGYRFMLLPEFGRIRDRFYGKARQVKLSQSAIEVLSLVAYNQPVTADEIARHRGLPSGSILSQLVRRQLLFLDRSDREYPKGRYSTTARFLQLFGLESLGDLPRSDDSGALGGT